MKTPFILLAKPNKNSRLPISCDLFLCYISCSLSPLAHNPKAVQHILNNHMHFSSWRQRGEIILILTEVEKRKNIEDMCIGNCYYDQNFSFIDDFVSVIFLNIVKRAILIQLLDKLCLNFRVISINKESERQFLSLVQWAYFLSKFSYLNNVLSSYYASIKEHKRQLLL